MALFPPQTPGFHSTIPKTAPSVRTAPEIEYQTTLKYLKQWQNAGVPAKSFADFLLQQKMAQATRIKHLRQARTLHKRKILIGDYDFGTLAVGIAKPPLQFTDDDFVKLYEAFNDVDFPRFIQAGKRYRFWQCVVHFASVTALRRKARMSGDGELINTSV